MPANKRHEFKKLAATASLTLAPAKGAFYNFDYRNLFTVGIPFQGCFIFSRIRLRILFSNFEISFLLAKYP